VVVAGVTLLPGSARPELDDRTATEDPLLESDAGSLAAERVRAGPAVLVRLGFAE
jgi:hypothetical protein